jgi:hypothetical protein
MNRHVNLEPCAAHAIARVGSRSPWRSGTGIGGFFVLK